VRVFNDMDLEIINLRGRINGLEILGKRYREALQKICDPDRCKWSAPEMFHIADAALKDIADNTGSKS
jgi:hypothetical protein